MDRINIIAQHLLVNDVAAGDVPTTSLLSVQLQVDSVEIQKLKTLLDTPKYTEFKDRVRTFIQNNPLFHGSVSGISSAEYKQRVLLQLKSLATSGLFNITDIRDNPEKTCAFIEVISEFNNNINTKFAVHYSLFGGTILLLGTERHEIYLPKADCLDIVGCFSMTEIGHGSNVRSLETTATYCPKAGGFIIHSPTPTSQKFWIGGAGLHAHYTTVFARLILGGKDHGVHAFVVPIRDQLNRVLPGVTIKDCGPKMGLNGIDNGQLAFDNVFIPRENLLNKYADVTPDGKYKSDIKPQSIFTSQMAALVNGRLYVCKSTVGVVKTCLTIATRYSHIRKQFGPPNSNGELPLITLSSQQKRLMVPIATTITMDLFTIDLAKKLANAKISHASHAHCAGIKAVFSWHLLRSIQQARESCGGQGYRMENRIAEFRCDSDIFVTYEGDNTVLMQQVAKYAMTLKPISIDRVVLGSKADLFNLVKLQQLFRLREQLRVDELKELIAKGGKDKFAAFNNVIPWAVATGYAHMHSVILDNAIHYINGNSIKPLPQMVLLDTLSKIEEDLGWFLSQSLISTDVAKQIPFVVMELCKNLSDHSLDIIKSFDIPAVCLPEPSLISDLIN
ncbi:acyl-CoA oxidase [Heterostelium album PN500]|uniref:Acyl-coenzyme A oxidase n=1 Tax=Heterostelium pallidum (strain ATCC 26659 / Pp 5 / PN500) TaxID=670386 RepID=D3BJ76_HETP5|nr:acyl-CoA oxidase [Heterostelium album PN500]EFA77956.1 acyl-CoA oxidase [Heterostelium album PN500]|eukprot:XP_020430084.1 acyl-CoA oxidase [Heterostelium album PN500]